MAELLINFGAITVPTPEPFDSNRPERQRESLAYVMMQVLAQMSANGIKLEIPDTFGVNVAGNMQGVEEAIRDLIGTSWSVKVGPLTFVKHGNVGLAAVEDA